MAWRSMDAEARLNLIPDRTLVDGGPVYWSSHVGQPTIALLFRVGRVDEPFAQLGVSHAVEHLALNALRGAQRFMAASGLGESRICATVLRQWH